MKVGGIKEKRQATFKTTKGDGRVDQPYTNVVFYPSTVHHLRVIGSTDIKLTETVLYLQIFYPNLSSKERLKHQIYGISINYVDNLMSMKI